VEREVPLPGGTALRISMKQPLALIQLRTSGEIPSNKTASKCLWLAQWKYPPFNFGFARLINL